MDLRRHALWLMFVSCGRPGDRVSDVRKPPDPPDVGRDASEQAPAAAPDVDLGPGFEPMGFVPGRYAVLVERNMAGVHARDRLTHKSRASLVLELGGDGAATACHGWKQENMIDRARGRQVHELSQQQGFRGTHVVRDGEVDVMLAADDTVCPEVRTGEARPRAAAMTLRCVLARPRGHATLTAPVLLCDWREADWGAYYPLTADGVAPERWIVLGGGNGVHAQVTGKTISSEGPPVKVMIEPATARIESNTWDRPLPLFGPSDEL